MTREEAIKWLQAINTREFGWDDYAMQDSQKEIRERCEQSIREAIDMAISALSADTIPLEQFHELQHCYVMLGATLADYIKKSANDVVETDDEVIEPNDKGGDAQMNPIPSGTGVMQQTPSEDGSDLVSVIRCKDCKHRYTYTNGTKWSKQCYLCDFMDALYDADGFCHHGERKG